MATVVVSDSGGGSGGTGMGSGWGQLLIVLAIIAAGVAALYLFRNQISAGFSGLLGGSGQGSGSVISGTGGSGQGSGSVNYAGAGSGNIISGTNQQQICGADCQAAQAAAQAAILAASQQQTAAALYQQALATKNTQLQQDFLAAIAAQPWLLSSQIDQEAVKYTLEQQVPGLLQAEPCPTGWYKQADGSCVLPGANTPIKQNHCPCTEAARAAGLCGPRDNWYYC